MTQKQIDDSIRDLDPSPSDNHHAGRSIHCWFEPNSWVEPNKEDALTNEECDLIWDAVGSEELLSKQLHEITSLKAERVSINLILAVVTAVSIGLAMWIARLEGIL